MKKDSILLSVTRFVRRILAKEGTGHDWWHIERVLNNARLICKSMKADMFVVKLAILLHDVGDRKVISKENDDPTIARNFLMKQKVPTDTIEKVMFIIENMSFSKNLNNKKEGVPIEFYIVQDADRLDAIGAIGIARAFSFGGSRARPIHDPTLKAQKLSTTKNYKKLQSSTYHHFYEKLLLLKNLMNTTAAKKIAEKRHSYMENFLKEFLLEWEGKR